MTAEELYQNSLIVCRKIRFIKSMMKRGETEIAQEEIHNTQQLLHKMSQKAMSVSDRLDELMEEEYE